MAEKTVLEERARPSAAHRWCNCNGSILFPPGEAGEYAREGSAAHALAEFCLRTATDPARYDLDTITFDDNGEKVTHAVDEEMRQYIGEYCAAVRKSAGTEKIYLEYKLPSGTMDAGIIFSVSDGVVEVNDLKYGYSPVKAAGNEQLTIYALELATVADMLGVDVKTFRLVIHQPRVRNTPDVWEVSAEGLAALGSVIAEAKQHADAVLGGRALPDYKAGDWCKYCTGKADCPAQKALAVAGFDKLGDAPADDKDIPAVVAAAVAATAPGELAQYLSKAKLLDGFYDALQARARELIMSGVEVPGYKLVAGRKGPRKWTDPAEAERRAKKAHRFKDEEVYEKKFVSPTKMEKVAGDKWVKYTDLVTQSDPAPSLVPADDKRKALEFACADDFEKMEDNTAPAIPAVEPTADDLW